MKDNLDSFKTKRHIINVFYFKTFFMALLRALCWALIFIIVYYDINIVESNICSIITLVLICSDLVSLRFRDMQ